MHGNWAKFVFPAAYAGKAVEHCLHMPRLFKFWQWVKSVENPPPTGGFSTDSAKLSVWHSSAPVNLMALRLRPPAPLNKEIVEIPIGCVPIRFQITETGQSPQPRSCRA